MKKRPLLVTLLVLLVCMLAVPALADGFAGDASDIRCENMQFAPVTNSSFTEGNIPWYCSVTFPLPATRNGNPITQWRQAGSARFAWCFTG